MRAGAYEATFRPDAAMLGASVRHRGEEFVVWPRPITQYRAGHSTAVPLLHPWANRLARRTYRAAGRRVDLRNVNLPVDPNGLPMHGTLRGVRFEVVRAEPHRVVGRLDYGAHPELLRAFPFPHTITVDARVDAARGLTVTTEVRPTGDRAVPISFGWHPFLRLPNVPRSEWELRWPASEHVDVDDRIIPTGVRRAQPATRTHLGGRTFDDHYALDRDRTFTVAARATALSVHFDRHYPFAQLYLPRRRPFVAIEPMTAEIDALGRGRTPLCPPGNRFRASFRISVTRGRGAAR